MCYLIVFQITLFVYAIVTFVKGKFQISHNWVATGAPAIFAGVIFLLPIPLTLVFGALLMMTWGRQVGFMNAEEMDRLNEPLGLALFLTTIGVTTACLSLAFLIAMINARDPDEVRKEERRRRPDDWDDDREEGTPIRGRY